jgi:hypothetical protein
MNGKHKYIEWVEFRLIMDQESNNFAEVGKAQKEPYRWMEFTE